MIKNSTVLTETITGWKIGVIRYSGITVSESPQMLKGRLQLFQESLYFEQQDKELQDFPGIKEWRKTFKLAGTDASRYRPSVEALYRRIKKQNYLQPVNSAIDINNFFSLQYEIPLGIYDSDRISGDITATIGSEADEYEGINGRMNSMNNMILTRDDLGPFGSPFVDSKRTMVTEKTSNAIQIVYIRPSMSIEEAKKLTASLMEMFTSIHGGQGSFDIQ